MVDGDTMDVGSKAKEKKLIVPSQDEGLDSQKLLPRKTALLVSIKEPDGEPQEVATSMSRKKSPQSSRINGESKDEKLATSKFSLINISTRVCSCAKSPRCSGAACLGVIC